MTGKSVPSIPALNRINDFASLLIVPFTHSGELVVLETGAAHGALLCPGYGHDVGTPTDTAATDICNFIPDSAGPNESIRSRDSGARKVVIACGSPKPVDGDSQQTARRRHQGDDGDAQGEGRRAFRFKGNGSFRPSKADEGTEAREGEASGETCYHDSVQTLLRKVIIAGLDSARRFFVYRLSSIRQQPTSSNICATDGNVWN